MIPSRRQAPPAQRPARRVTVRGALRLGGAALIAACLGWTTPSPAQPQTTPAPNLASVAPPVRAAIEEETRRVVTLLQSAEGEDEMLAGWLSLGDTLFAHEFGAEARVAYDAAAALGDADGQVPYRQGLLAVFEGRLDDAIPAFNRAVSAPDEALQASARVRRGRAYLEQGDWRSAEVDFAAALVFDADSPAALGGAGRAALAGGNPEAAVEYLERALRIDPGASLLYQPLGLAYRELGDRERARAALAQVGEGEPDFEDPVLAAIQTKSRSPQFWLQSGLAQAERGDFAGAADLIGRAAALAPEDLDILASYGRVLAQLGEYELSLKALERVVTGADPEPADWLYLGRVQQALGQLEPARDAYRRAGELDPADPVPREALARIDLYDGRFAAAVQGFRALGEAAGAPRERARYGYWEGLALLAQDDCAAAAPVIGKAMAADEPVAADLLQVAARIRATCDDTLAPSVEEAVSWAELAYNQQPGLLSAETLAMAYAAAGRWRDAEDLQAQAIFEALKLGALDQRPALQENMARYRERQPAVQPYAPDDPLFRR